MEKELTQKCIQNYDAESDKKKTISYPKHIQKIHNDYELMLKKCIN